MKITISGNGMADLDGDMLWIEIHTDQTQFRLTCPADQAELLQEAFTSAIASGLREVDRDKRVVENQPTISPITIEVYE